MWICPICDRKFERTNQAHSCLEKTLDDFLQGKTEQTTRLFYYFITEYRALGNITVHPTKSMIAIAGRTRLAYVTQLGKNFIHIVFPFKQAYPDNLCFINIRQVPGTHDYNHHFRMYFEEDVNEEVKYYMKLALENS